MTSEPQKKSTTKVIFDLNDVLSPEEVEKFTAAAKAAKKSLTNHFLSLTIKKEVSK